MECSIRVPRFMAPLASNQLTSRAFLDVPTTGRQIGTWPQTLFEAIRVRSAFSGSRLPRRRLRASVNSLLRVGRYAATCQRVEGLARCKYLVQNEAMESHPARVLTCRWCKSARCSARARRPRRPIRLLTKCAFFGVDVDQYTVGCLALAAVAGNRVTVVEMRVIFEVKLVSGELIRWQ